MTGSDYSQEVNKLNKHDISIYHSFTTKHLSQVFKVLNINMRFQPFMTSMLDFWFGMLDDELMN